MEDLVTCKVCFEIYERPQSLSCLHVLCVHCTERLTRHNYVECPECRHETRYTDIKNDFNKQTLVDLYLQQQRDDEAERGDDRRQSLLSFVCEEESPVLTCESCKKHKAVKWKCETCKKYMCEDCELAHKSFPFTANHNVKSIEEISTEITSDIGKALILLRSEQSKLKIKSSVEGNILHDLERIKFKTAQDINAHRDDLKKSIDMQHNDLIGNLETKITCEVNAVVAKKQTIDKHIMSLDQKIALMEELYATKDVATLVNRSEAVNQEVKTEMKCVSTSIAGLEVTSLPQVRVTAPLPWDESTGSKLTFIVNADGIESIKDDNKMVNKLKIPHQSKVDNLDLTDQSNQNEVENGFLKLLQLGQEFVHRRGIYLPFTPTRLQIVGNTLWCTGENTFHVYNFELEWARSIKLNLTPIARSVVEDHLKQLIAACPCWKGLHLLDSNGTYMYLIGNGNFSDVVFHGMLIYALEISKCAVQVFEYKQESGWFTTQNKWMLKTEIILKDLESHETLDTLDVCADDIYVCTKNVNIYRYNVNSGKMVAKFGKSGQESPGSPQSPHLCNVDSNGNVLMVDECSNTLQVCDSSGEWSNVELPEMVSCPRDAVVDNSGRNIWVCNRYNRLVHYTIKNTPLCATTPV